MADVTLSKTEKNIQIKAGNSHIHGEVKLHYILLLGIFSKGLSKHSLAAPLMKKVNFH